MANFKLSELNSVAKTKALDLIYLVQDDLSKNISIQDTFNELPVDVKTTGSYDIISPGDNGGQYLSGGQPVEDTLSNTFIRQDTALIIEERNQNNAPFFFPSTTNTPLSSFSNHTIFLSGDSIDTSTYPANRGQRLDINLDARYIPDGFYVKFIQSGRLPLVLSAHELGAGQVLSVNNTLTSGPALTDLSTPTTYQVMEIYKLPESGGQNRFVVTQTLSCNGVGVDASYWQSK